MRTPAYISMTVVAMASLACLNMSDWIPTEEHVSGETLCSDRGFEQLWFPPGDALILAPWPPVLSKNKNPRALK